MRTITIGDSQLAFTLRLLTVLGLSVDSMNVVEKGFSLSVSGQITDLPVQQPEENLNEPAPEVVEE
jgi:hypothetical protein